MDFNQIIYQIYPFGMCDAPKENDGITVNRISRVLDFVPHLVKLGVTAVWFCPVFESDRHGYDTRNYRKIDCRLGSNSDFQVVCDALHKAGIRVILDGVFNHVGRGFGPFRDVQEKKWDSPYADWFNINFNDTWARDGFTYENWEGHEELVRLNLKNPNVRDYLLKSIDLWVKFFGIDGLRLDVAYMVDRDFLRELKAHVKAINPDFLLLGEIINGDYNVLLKDCGLDSVTNYECRKGIYSSLNSHNLFEIGFSLNRQFGPENWTLYKGEHLLSFVDNHDVNRIASELTDKRDIPLAYDLIYAMPGMPCLYYGSEWGMEGMRSDWSDDALRPSVRKPEWNALTDHIAMLSTIRKNHPVFANGSYEQCYIQNEQLVFRRKDENETAIFAINCADHEVTVPSPLSKGIDCTTEKEADLSGGIHLEAKSSRFFVERSH